MCARVRVRLPRHAARVALRHWRRPLQADPSHMGDVMIIGARPAWRSSVASHTSPALRREGSFAVGQGHADSGQDEIEPGRELGMGGASLRRVVGDTHSTFLLLFFRDPTHASRPWCPPPPCSLPRRSIPHRSVRRPAQATSSLAQHSPQSEIV